MSKEKQDAKSQQPGSDTQAPKHDKRLHPAGNESAEDPPRGDGSRPFNQSAVILRKTQQREVFSRAADKDPRQAENGHKDDRRVITWLS